MRNTSIVDAAIITILVLSSGIYIYFNENLTAFEWSAMDMGPFWERQANSDFLKNDFFTNASSDLSPRHFFGGFISILSRWLDAPWYSVVYFFKLFLLLLCPVLVYKALESVAIFLSERNEINMLAKLTLMLASVILLKQEEFLAVFAIAWWKPITFQTTSAAFSFFLCLLNFITVGQREWIFLCGRSVIWVLAILFHPAIAVFMFIFYTIILLFGQEMKQFSYRKHTWILIWEGIPILVGQGLVWLIYGNSAGLVSTKEFIEIYVQLRHSYHYDIYNFASASNWVWREQAMIISLVFLGLTLSLKRHCKGKIFYLPLLFCFIYWGAIFSQWFFIYIVPIKAVAMLGPVRYSFLSYYQCVLCVVILVNQYDFFRCKKYWISPFFYVFPVILAVSVLFLGMSRIDDPFKKILGQNAEFYSWVSSTPNDAVFVVPDNELSYHLGLVGNRAIFIGGGFPFLEKYFVEYRKRHEAVYGSYEESSIQSQTSWIDVKEDNIYNSRTMTDFLCLSQRYKIDYVIRYAYSPFDERYNSSIVFSGREYVVYNLEWQGEYSCQ